MKNIFLTSILVLICSILFAQEVISPAGETQTTQACEISWTLGEVAIETVSGSTSTLTQGFQQPQLIVNPQTGIQFVGIDLKVYPNPTTNFVIIEIGQTIEKVRYALYNNNGSLVEQNEITSTNTKLDFSLYASGQYILKLNQNKSKPIQTFKIIKR